MTTQDEHLSMFELDLFFASNTPDARIESHVAACERCSGYLSELSRLQASAPLPEPRRAPPERRWPAASRAAPPSPDVRPRPRRLALPLVASLALLGTVIALSFVRREPEQPAVAVKGSPAVQLLVRRGANTRPWDGVSRVRAGDVLGLRVACDGFRRVAVAAASRNGWSAVSEGACPRAGGALPFTLVVDDAPGREQLAVVFSASALQTRALSDAIERRRLDADAWVTRFELDKEAVP